MILAAFVYSANAASCNVEKDQDIENFSRCLNFANNGDANAQFEIAYKYYYGIGGPQDVNQAFKWYKKSAEQGNYLAQNILATMFYNGTGVVKDYKQAFKWYMKSAEQGHPYAPFNLGKMYYMGEGVPQDIVHSLMWCYISEKRGILKAGKFRFEIEKKLMPDEIKKARKLAKAWIEIKGK
jgi:TPR repeat protein